MFKKVIITLIVFLMLPLGLAAAQHSDTREITGESFQGDVTLLNEDLIVSESGEVDGNVTLFNGNAMVDGTIKYDLVVFNGDVTLGRTAVIQGECILINGSLTNDESQQQCQVINENPFNFDADMFNNIGTGLTFETEAISFGSRLWASIGGALGLSILMGTIAIGIYSALPHQSEQIEAVLRQHPYSSIAIGGLSFVAIPFINAILLVLSVVLSLVCIGLLGFPIILTITFAFIVAGCWAWVLWGKIIGDWAADRLERQLRPPLTAAAGTAVVTFLFGFLTFINPITGVLAIILALLMQSSGMGAAALTRFGTQSFPAPIPKLDSDKVTAVLKTLPDEETAP